MPRSRIDATLLVTALMDMADLAEVVLTDDVLEKVAADQLEVNSNQTDPTLRPGAYRLRVVRQRPQIVVPGHIVTEHVTGTRRALPPG